MESPGDPNMIKHMRVHCAISHQVHAYKTGHEENCQVVDVDRFLALLSGWLKGHTATSNLEYIPYVKKLGS